MDNESSVTMKPFEMSYIDSHTEHILLFLHGFPFNGTMWLPQVDGLANVARVLAPDLRGFGRSTMPNGGTSMRIYAQDCAQLLDSLNITQPIVLCGLSMGGYIALEFMRRYPDKVNGLVLAATRARADSADEKTLRTESVKQIRQQGLESMIDGMLSRTLAPTTLQHQPAIVNQMRDMMLGTSRNGAINALLAMRDRPNSFNTLPQINVPTLLLFGTEDKIVPLAEAEAMQRAIPEAYLETLPRAGHLPNVERAGLFNQIVSEFLSEL